MSLGMDGLRSAQTIPPSISEYWNHRDELSVTNDLVFKAEKFVISSSLRKLMLESVHSSHMGVENHYVLTKDVSRNCCICIQLYHLS